MAVKVRALDEKDAADFQALRLRSLKEHPEAFGLSFEEAEQVPQEEIARYLMIPDCRTFGAYSNGLLVGIATLMRYSLIKTHHRAVLSGMYVLSG